jgi:protein-S-isoprenylcysteine O-methyltransferase Ste14
MKPLNRWLTFVQSLLITFVVVYIEEPHLREKFGSSFEKYCRGVPRWL